MSPELAAVRRAARKLDKAKTARAEAMRAARAAGESTRAIGAAAGVSHVAVIHITNGAE